MYSFLCQACYHIGSHSVNFRLTGGDAPCFNPSWAGHQYLIYLI